MSKGEIDTMALAKEVADIAWQSDGVLSEVCIKNVLDLALQGASAQTRREVVEETKALVRKLTAVVEDFLPNIGRCALQDYGRLNEALCESRAFLAEQEVGDE